MQYDIISKRVSERFPADFAELIIGKAVQKIDVLSRELPLTEHRSDGLCRVTEDDQKFILHIEFQNSHDSEMPKRMLSYYVRIMDKYDLPVYPVVIYLNPKDANRAIEDSYTSRLRSRQVIAFSYEVIRIWDIRVDHIFDNHLYGLYPFTPLAKGAKLSECIEKVDRAVKDKYLDSDTYMCMRVIAELKYPKEVIEDMLDDMLEKSEIYRELIEKGEKKGMEESIISVLITRFGEIPDKVSQRIYSIRNSSVLPDLLKLAVTSRDIDEFERRLSA
ncbi:MAG: hypothetical protein U9N09_07755 [Euryarchaeota archaeon]|nr:hypothetical protein [Euryarchaeota archaeon]